MNQIVATHKEVTLSCYPTTNEELRRKLWDFKLENGYFRRVLAEEHLYKTLQAIVATGSLSAIIGWTGIYETSDYNWYSNKETFIGVFVDYNYRHQGLGSRLKEEAMKVCIAQGKDFVWQDRKEDKWVRVSAKDGTERRSISYFG